jgi:uncharacterized protein (DUF58 family)
MRPSKYAIFILCGLLLLALITAILRVNHYEHTSNLSSLWFSISLLTGIIFLLDLFNCYKNPATFSIRRSVPSSISIGKTQAIHLEVINRTQNNHFLEIAEHLPTELKTKEKLPFTLSLLSNQKTIITYHITATKRGDITLAETELRLLSRLKLWNVKQIFNNHKIVKVYPDFLSIAHLSALHDKHQAQQLGLHQVQRRGQGTDFHQLRDHRNGDSLKNVDWKATSRRRKLITREYQDERDQEVLFLLDCGRNMRSKDDDLSHFDHCLNALLLSSYVALRNGDSVSSMTFAGQQRYISPVKGPHSINTILNGIYDLHTSLNTADYITTAKKVISKQRKRALIIIITNVNNNAKKDILEATRLLSRHHLLMGARIQETAVEKSMQTAVESMEDALQYSSAIDYVNQRHSLLQQLKNEGIFIIDSPAKTMHHGLLNEYMALKRSGQF